MIFGDSHVHALARALARKPEIAAQARITVLRILRPKAGGAIGDAPLPDIAARAAALGPGDALVSAVGGHHYLGLGLVRHGQPFAVMAPENRDTGDRDTGDHVTGNRDTGNRDTGTGIIPAAVARAELALRLRRDDLPRLSPVMAAAPAGVTRLHLCAPPPKGDDAFVAAHAEATFQALGLAARGLAPRDLRRALWAVQCAAESEVFAPLGLSVLPPPPGTVDAQGFLDMAFAARDASHANSRYGVRVLRQVILARNTAPAAT